MIKITPEDLVQYLYKETSVKKTAAIRAALETDWDLQQAFKEILSAQKNLAPVNHSPRNESLNKILEHASSKVGQMHS
jgi:hypothetical protein